MEPKTLNKTFLSKLNNIKSAAVEFKKITELNINKPYQIRDAEKTFNKRLNKYSILLKIMDLETKQVYRSYLPARFSTLTETEAGELIGMNLTYIGEMEIENTNYFTANIMFS